MRSSRFLWLLSLLCLVPTAGRAAETAPAKVLGRTALAFEPNFGQSDPQVRYLSRGAGYTLFLTRDEAVLSLISGAPASAERKGASRPDLRSSVLRVKPLGAQLAESLEPEQTLAGRSHYTLSNPEKTLRDVPRYGRVRARGIYPGIDLVYYGSGEKLEYDFVVAPGADPSRIRLGFEGAENLSLDEAGNLHLRLATGELVQHAPVIYQERAGRRMPVTGRFQLAGNAVGFEVGAYDPTLPLTIDPVLAWASLLGGESHEWVLDVAVTPNGQAYACGYTNSTRFPTRPQQDDPDSMSPDAYVTKFNLDGSGIDWSHYFGGPDYQQANGIALDYNRGMSVTGVDGNKAWIFHLDASGTLEWSKTVGGSYSDRGDDVFMDSALNTYVVGTTFATYPDYTNNFPVKNAAQPVYGGGDSDAFVMKLNRFGTVLWATYYGGPLAESGGSVTLDLNGRTVFAGHVIDYSAQVTNYDGFAARLSADGSVYQGRFTFGGSVNDFASGIAVDPSGNVWVAGTTYSGNFPMRGASIDTHLDGESDAFLARMLNNWSDFSYSTYIGSGRKEVVAGLLVDDAGRLYPVGQITEVNNPSLYDLWAAHYIPSNNTVSTLVIHALGNEYVSGCAMDNSRWIYFGGVTNDKDIVADFPFAFQRDLRGIFDGLVAKVGF